MTTWDQWSANDELCYEPTTIRPLKVDPNLR